MSPAPYIESCCICRKEFPEAPEYFLPLYEGKVVNTDKTDDWAAMPCCEQCYLDHQHMWGQTTDSSFWYLQKLCPLNRSKPVANPIIGSSSVG